MRATILVTEQLSLFELASAIELFALPREEFEHWYTTKVVALKRASFNGLCETQFHCEKVVHIPASDLLVIPSFPVGKIDIDAHLQNEVLKHYERGGRIISFCSGAFLLAELGLLDGRVATTHWRYADRFKSQFPHINYKDDILYQYDGVIGCSAGSAAGIDLGIEVIRQDFGYDCANAVARRLVLPAHRNGGQAQFVEKPIVKTKSNISQTLDWAVLNLSPELTISDMARNANMTRRTFDRQFKKHYKMTPLHWLLERKVDKARQLLESTNYSMEQLAQLSGFESAVTLRHNFKKCLSISPMDYRLRFRGDSKSGNHSERLTTQ
ncbi:MAG: helix-turn-helix domain-containing protein [Aestuariibacter sp.]